MRRTLFPALATVLLAVPASDVAAVTERVDDDAVRPVVWDAFADPTVGMGNGNLDFSFSDGVNVGPPRAHRSPDPPPPQIEPLPWLVEIPSLAFATRPGGEATSGEDRTLEEVSAEFESFLLSQPEDDPPGSCDGGAVTVVSSHAGGVLRLRCADVGGSQIVPDVMFLQLPAVVPVPEPTSLALTSLGVAAMVALSRSRGRVPTRGVE